MSLETHAFNAYNKSEVILFLEMHSFNTCNKNEVTLPLHTLLTDDEVEYVAKTYKENLN